MGRAQEQTVDRRGLLASVLLMFLTACLGLGVVYTLDRAEMNEPLTKAVFGWNK